MASTVKAHLHTYNNKYWNSPAIHLLTTETQHTERSCYHYCYWFKAVGPCMEWGWAHVCDPCGSASVTHACVPVSQSASAAADRSTSNITPHQQTSIKQPLLTTRMWANAQRDGRPAKHRWRSLFNAAKFGWRPLLECRAVTLPRRETNWNLQGCPKLTKRSQPLAGRSSPYCEDKCKKNCRFIKTCKAHNWHI